VCRNYYQLFNGILTPRQLEGLRLLLTPFPQQQFNATDDRRSELPSQGAACFDSLLDDFAATGTTLLYCYGGAIWEVGHEP
jgi:hypothetical protein